MAGIRLMGLWPKQAQDQSWYLEGILGGGIVRVYENKYKRNDKDPSHVVYLSEKPKDNKGKGSYQKPQGGGFAPQQGKAAQPANSPRDESPAWDSQDPGPEIPF